MSSIMSDEAIDMLMAISTGEAQKAAAKKYPGVAKQVGGAKMMRPLKPSGPDKPLSKKQKSQGQNDLEAERLMGVNVGGAERKAAQRTDLENMVISKARAAGVSPAVALALIAHESNWDPNARSHSSLPDEKFGGARGLFQMLTPTARALGFTGADDDLFDPATNINYGIKLLKANQKRVGNSPADLFAAHNSGKAFAKAPKSTRDVYVPATMKLYEELSSRYPDEEAQPTGKTAIAEATPSASTAAQQQMLQNGGSAVPR